jgi:serine/threonine protein kinase
LPNIVSELRELAALLDRGLITLDEFKETKAGLMAGRDKTSGTHSFGSKIQSGSVLGNYKVMGVIGTGGMGVVYRARNVDQAQAAAQGGDVALKVLHSQYSENPRYRTRFEREASLGLRLNHPGIVGAYELLEEDGVLGLVLELVEGRELADVIGKEVGPIPYMRALELFQHVLSAVDYAHEHKVIHRDIKPENIMVTADGSIKVLDFGIAKELGSGKTKTGTGMGTIHYMAPEQYTDASKVDARADIYALGITLYEMLAGRLPWDSEATEFDILNRKVRGDFPPPTEFYEDIPPSLVSVLLRAYEVDPENRYGTIAEFSAALDKVLTGDSEDFEAKVTLDRSDLLMVNEEVDDAGFTPNFFGSFPHQFSRKGTMFSGRAARKEFLGFWFASLLLLPALGIIGGGLFSNNGDAFALFIGVLGLVFFIIALGLSVRRLHDLGHSGEALFLWLFVCCLPAGALVLVLLYFVVLGLKGSVEDNQYGPKPQHGVW